MLPETSLDGNQENVQAVIDNMTNEVVLTELTITIERVFQKCVFCVYSYPFSDRSSDFRKATHARRER